MAFAAFTDPAMTSAFAAKAMAKTHVESPLQFGSLPEQLKQTAETREMFEKHTAQNKGAVKRARCATAGRPQIKATRQTKVNGNAPKDMTHSEPTKLHKRQAFETKACTHGGETEESKTQKAVAMACAP